MADSNPGQAAGLALDDAQAGAGDVRRLHREEAIWAWLVATDRAIAALQEWRGRLVTWQVTGTLGQELGDPAQLDAALGDLDAAGLGEWAEWGAGGDLDGLSAALFPGK